jgi:hypothetical protein
VRIRLHIDIEANEETRAALAELVVEQPVVLVRQVDAQGHPTPHPFIGSGRLVGASGAEGSP